MSEGLPKGWVRVPLAELVVYIIGGDWGADDDQGRDGLIRTRVVRGTDFRSWRSGKGSVAAERWITPSSLEKRQLRQGDLILEVSGGGPHQPVGRTVLVDSEVLGRADAPLLCTNFFRLIRLSPRLDPEYVVRYLELGYARREFDRFQTETTNLRNLDVGDFLAGFCVALPPIAEQGRIAAALKAVVGKLDASRDRLAKIPRLLKRFRQSILAAACSGRLTADWRQNQGDTAEASVLLDMMREERRAKWKQRNRGRAYREAAAVIDEEFPEIPREWAWTNFDHCSWEITVGHVGPMKDRYTETGVPFLRSQNVRPLRYSSKGLVRVPPEFSDSLNKSRLEGGEILVTRSGANTGDCCVYPRSAGTANCSDLVITRPLSGLVAEYGALYISSPKGQARLGLAETGIAQPHFNIGAMRVKAFPLPPLAEQHEIVRRVDQLFALADRLETRYAKAQAQVDKLAQSLLAKAFRGELVPQDPNDEPAAVLLERIRAERQQAGAEPKRRRGRVAK